MMTEEWKEQKTEDVANWMKHMEENSEAQKKYAKKQYVWSKISACCNLCIACIAFVCAVIIVPKVVNTLSTIDGAMERVDSAMVRIDSAMTDFEDISAQLKDADIKAMLDNVNTLVVDCEEDMKEAFQKIDEIAVDELNEAITDLKSVVEPLARLFGKKDTD